MREVLLIVDMQNDFCTGTLANTAAEEIVPGICELLKTINAGTEVILTRDTHASDYLKTQEGKKLPIEHCLRDTAGWCIHDEILRTLRDRSELHYRYEDKHTFGQSVWNYNFDSHQIDRITLVGTCTDICVISNALILKAKFPEMQIKVIGNLCAGTTPEKHRAALEVMKSCQIEVIE